MDSIWQHMMMVTATMQRNVTRNPRIHTTAASEDVAITFAELLAADGRMDGRTAATKRPSRYTYVASTGLLPHRRWSSDRRCVPPACATSPSHELTSVRRQHGRAAPVGTELPRFCRPPRPPILEAAGWSPEVMANAIYLSSCSSRGRRRDNYRDHRGNGSTKCRIIKSNERIDKQSETIAKAPKM